MAGAPLLTNPPIERPTFSSGGTHVTSPWLEPFLVKHSSWYRRHLTSAGRRESKRPSRNSSVTTTTSTSYTTDATPKENRASVDVDEDEQWRQVEEEFRETASAQAHERDGDRRVREV